MRYITDFHLHSKYSRATSKNMDLEHLDKWAKLKGIQILGTGDFTHPLWLKELQRKLISLGNGLYRLKNKIISPIYFILTTEISCIYKKNNKTRRIHLLVFAPSLEVVKKINQKLGKKFNLHSDGRPILGIDAKELLKIILDISSECFIVPAHLYTPWYSIFGSKSGFDSLEECFEDCSKHIYAGETGLSSDPPASWRNSKLDRITLISNSDAHSPKNLGREANVFDLENLSYRKIIKTIKTKKGFKYTIEFFPEEGKYYLDGHRSCQLSLTPEETKKYKGICPCCGKPLTIGVIHRINDLADRKDPKKPLGAPDFKHIIPLTEIIGQVYNLGKNSKKVQTEYFNLLNKARTGEFNVLLDLKEEELLMATSPEIVQGIIRMRENKIEKQAGYDGTYGKIKILLDGHKQKKLF